MSEAVLASIISAVSPIVVAIVSVYLNSRLISYKVDQLEKKVEKHNSVVERLTVLERTTDAGFSTVWQRYDDLKDEYDREIERLRKESA